MQNVHLIEVKYIPASRTKGSRVKFTSLRFKDSITIPYNHAYNSIDEMFLGWLKDVGSDLGAMVLGYNDFNGTYIFGTTVYERLKNIAKGGVLV